MYLMLFDTTFLFLLHLKNLIAMVLNQVLLQEVQQLHLVLLAQAVAEV